MAANESNRTRGISKENETGLVIDCIRPSSLNSLVYSGCVGIALDAEVPWSRRESKRKGVQQKTVIKR